SASRTASQVLFEPYACHVCCQWTASASLRRLCASASASLRHLPCWLSFLYRASCFLPCAVCCYFPFRCWPLSADPVSPSVPCHQLPPSAARWSASWCG